MVYYNRLLTRDLSVSVGWGFGFQAFTFKLAETPDFYETEILHYWKNAEYDTYQKLALRGLYDFQLDKNGKLRFNLGVGLQFLPMGRGHYSFSFDEINTYTVRYDYRLRINPIAVIGLDYVFTLKNKDELGFGLLYNHSFRNIYNGIYILPDTDPIPACHGIVFGSGTTLGLNVSYVFTGNLTRQKIEARSEVISDDKAARKEVRKEQRYIDPKAIFVNIYRGTGRGITKVNDPGAYLVNSAEPEFFAGIDFEQGIKNNFFVNAGYHFLQYYHSVGIVSSGTWSARTWSGYSLFYTHDFTVGGGYRIITPENYKLLNVYGGLAFGFISSPKGIVGSSEIYVSHRESSEYFFKASYTGKTVSKLILGAYLGVSKDFRLTDFLYFSLNYRFQQGFNPVFESDIVYESSYFEGNEIASAKIDGTAHLFSLGLKLRFR